MNQIGIPDRPGPISLGPGIEGLILMGRRLDPHSQPPTIQVPSGKIPTTFLEDIYAEDL